MDKRKSRRARLRGKPIALAVATAFLPWNHALALPQGGEVVAGQATISKPQDKTLQIDQASPKAILDWKSFSIRSNETVNFNQPSASAVALNRVVGSSSSEIYGALNANGQVFLVNTNGILFAPGSSVNVGGLVATTLNITNEDFLSGNYVFQRDAGEPSRSVVNRGSIVTPSGYTALFGPQVRNEGVIIANSGSIALGAGDRVSLDLVGDNLIRVNVEQAALKASIVNTGSLLADGGTVMLKASSAGGLLDTVINTSGVIRANALVERDGAIVLDGGSSGITAMSGSLQAAGGAISVAGDTVALLGAARLDASGEAGGGTVRVDAGVLVVGGNASVRADATVSGSGGRVVLAGRDATSVHGAVSAQGAAGGAGGVVETSGGRYLNVSDAPAVGAGGTWIIASDSIVVANGSEWNSLGASLIGGQLDAGANVVLDARGADGDVTINSAIGKASANAASLTLAATDAVTVNSPISLASGGLTVNADALTNNSTITNSGGVAVANNIVFNADAFNLAGGTISSGSAVILRPRTGTNSFGIEAAGDTSVTNADLASINTSNFVVFGSGMGTTFTGNMIIGQNAAVNGGTKSLAFFRSLQPGGTTTIGSQGVTTGGDVIISAGGGAIVSNGGTVRGDEVQLRAREGIGSALAPVRTAANALGIVNTSFPLIPGSMPLTGNVFVSEADAVTLRDITLNVGGIVNSTSNFSSGTLALTAGGAIDIAGAVQTLGSLTLTAEDSVTVNAPVSVAGGGLTVNADALTNTSAITSTAGGGIPNNIVLNADAFNLAGGTVNATSAVILRPRTGTNSFGIEAAGDTTVTNADLARINTNDFVVLGSGMGTTFTGNMIIGQNAQVNGGTKNLAFFRSQQPGGTTSIGSHGLSTGGDVIINAGGGAIVSNGGTVAGDEVQLRAREGIGSAVAPVRTAANALGIVNTSFPLFPGSTPVTGNVFVSEADNVTLRDVTLNVGGLINTAGNFSSGAMTVTAGGALDIFGTVQSLGAMTLSAAGINEFGVGRIAAPALTSATTGNTLLTGPNAIGAFSGSSSAVITLNNAGALTVSSLNAGGSASLNNSGDVMLSGPWSSGAASLTTTGEGSDLIVAGTVNSAGPMTLTIAGDLAVRAAGSQHAMLVSNGGQTITARSIAVSSEDGRIADINNFGGDQNITATGTGAGAGIDVLTLDPAGLARIGSIGNQSIVVAGDHLNVHGLGGGSAIITAAGSQTIAMTGLAPKRIALGSDNAQGLSTISSSGNQAITGNADISLIGGSSPFADQSNAVIVNVNASGTQTIHAGNLHLASSMIGGNNSFAGIQATRQVIHATGNVTLTGGRSGGPLGGARIGGRGGVVSTPTHLTLTAGGDVILTSGLAGNGVSLGSTAAAGSGPFANNIAIDAGGSVILNSGPGVGARIGGSAAALPAPGDITIRAGNGIELNGAAQPVTIRTLGDVTLDANYISETANGFVVADTLSTRSVGDTSLTGPNQIKSFSGSSTLGNVTLVNTLPLRILGVTAAGDVIVDNSGDVTVGGAEATSATLVYAPGDVTINAPGFTIVVQGSNTTAGAGSEVRAGGTATLNAQEVLLIDGTAPDAPATVISGAAP